MLSHKEIPVRCFVLAVLLVMFGRLFTPALVAHAQLTDTCPVKQGDWNVTRGSTSVAVRTE
jgi:hypothetical protein